VCHLPKALSLGEPGPSGSAGCVTVSRQTAVIFLAVPPLYRNCIRVQESSAGVAVFWTGWAWAEHLKLSRTRTRLHDSGNKVCVPRANDSRLGSTGNKVR